MSSSCGAHRWSTPPVLNSPHGSTGTFCMHTQLPAGPTVMRIRCCVQHHPPTPYDDVCGLYMRRMGTSEKNPTGTRGDDEHSCCTTQQHIPNPPPHVRPQIHARQHCIHTCLEQVSEASSSSPPRSGHASLQEVEVKPTSSSRVRGSWRGHEPPLLGHASLALRPLKQTALPWR